MKKRILQALITCTVMSSLIITPVLATPGINELKQNVDDLKQQKAQAEAEAASVNNELSDLLLEFNALQLDMDNQEKKIQEASDDLVTAEEKEKQQYEDMKMRIKYMYEQGDASVIETLVQAKDFTDLVNKAEYVQEVHTYDREQLNEYVETKNEVKQLKENLEEGHAEMQALSDEMEVQKTNLEGTLERMENEIENFDEELEEAKAAAAAELQRLQEEAERAAREEEEQREQQNNANSNSDSSSNNSSSNNNSSNNNSTNDNSSNDNSSNNNSSNNDNADGNIDTDKNDEPTVSKPSNTSLGQQIADMGCRYIGNRYVYGGNSLTNGIDCSGFVQQIHAKFGIYTARTSSALRYGGKAVSYSDMLPGDVICYSGHVAIYIGNNTIVHASNSAPYPKGGIKTSSPVNYRTVLAVRRYW